MTSSLTDVKGCTGVKDYDSEVSKSVTVDRGKKWRNVGFVPHPGGLSDAECLSDLERHKLSKAQVAAVKGQPLPPPAVRGRKPGQVSGRPSTMRDLDAREQAVVRMTLAGLTQAKMAEELSVHLQTIKTIKCRRGVKDAIEDRLLALDQRVLKHLAEGEASAAKYLADVVDGAQKPHRDRVMAAINLLDRMGRRGPVLQRMQQQTITGSPEEFRKALAEPAVLALLKEQGLTHALTHTETVVGTKLLSETTSPEGESAIVYEDDAPPPPEEVVF